MTVSAVIVNYRTPDLTVAAARSVAGEPEVTEVLVVDNASGDGSVDVLQAAGLHVIGSPVNAGFGGGVNLAAPAATGSLLFLLNSDATLAAGSMAPLVARLGDDRSRSVGVVAPAVYEADGRTLQADALGPFPRPFDRRWGSADPATETAPDWVSGVAMLLRRQDFLDLGGFDPDLAMYLEDVDLCRRVRARGQAVVREPAASVVHLGGRSWTSHAEQHARFHASKLVYFRKAGATPLQLAYLRATGLAWRLATRLW